MSEQSRNRVLGWIIVMVAVATGATLEAQEGGLKIGVVDVERVVAESPQGQELQGKLEAFQSEVQAQLNVMQDEARAIRRRITEGANTLSEDRVTQLEKEYEDAGIAIRRYRDDKQREGQKLQEEGLREIEQVLQPVFEQAREEMGLDLIINRVPGVIILTSDRVDITEAMLQRVAAASGGGSN